MTTKKIKAKEPANDEAAKKARMCNNPVIMSAITSETFASKMLPDMDVGILIDELNAETKEVMDGDMAMMEAMLVGQAKALQTIFVSLARKASSQEYLKNYGMFMNLALKAQSQSRATIQALTELKYPKQVAFVKQANIAHGHQQINNGDNTHASPTHAPTYAEEIPNQPNKLLVGEHHGSPQMDKRATSNAIRKNKAMATLDK
jgi:hypothetical protein